MSPKKSLHCKMDNLIKHMPCSTFYYYFVGLAYQGQDIVFRLIIENSSLRDFGP
jgi:hypothetical protein